jgi:hypothetical protein
MHPNVKSLIGKTFGRLLVVGTAPRPEGSKGRGQHWECVCTCLEMLVVRSDSLMQGKSTSCGCTNAVTTAMRANIKRIRTKPTISVHPEQACPKSNPTAIPSMNETNTTISAEQAVSISVSDLEALRSHFTSLDPNGIFRYTNDGLRIIDGALMQKHWPRTVKGEAMGEQTARFSGIGIVPHATGNLAQGEHLEATLKFRPALVNLSERKHSHYFKKCPYDVVDVYRVLALFGVTDPCFQHALKKILLAGDRKHKDVEKDVQEAIDTLARWKDMREEDIAACRALQDLMGL